MLLILPFLAFSQEEAKFLMEINTLNLDDAFEKIEAIYDVRFSYQDDVIDVFKVTLKKEKRTSGRG